MPFINKNIAHSIIISLLGLLFFYNHLDAQHIVRTADELSLLLSEDKDQGDILLDGDLFSIAGLNVKAGGVIKPYPGRKPIIIGFYQKVTRNDRDLIENGYWNVRVKSYGSTQIIFLDDNFDAIPYSCGINGMNGFELKANQILSVDKVSRLVKLPIPNGYDYLKNRDKVFFKNFSIKMGYWFVGIELRNLYSDGEFLYGYIDNNYNFNLLSIRPSARVYLEFFNLPISNNDIYLDGNDVLHVPAKYKTAYICTTQPIFILTGNRNLTFEHITFTGANNDTIDVMGSNKHFLNCTIKNCGKGIISTNGTYSNCSVISCLFDNLYNNSAIGLSGVNNVVIDNNIIYHTGTLLKGGPVISVAGLDFKVTNNKVSDFSYMAISVGNSREYRPGTISGIVSNNIVDNLANYGNAHNQLDDGGGIYVLTHTDGVEISNNIVRNIGYENAWMHGIYLDDGAYNLTVRFNLVYNIFPNSKTIYSRNVESCERSNMNNIFEGNICVGNCVMSGNRKGFGNKTRIKENFIAGDFENTDDDYVDWINNHSIEAEIQNNDLVLIKKKCSLKKRYYSRTISKLIKFRR